eukprot:GEZU01044467.1.p1 GENE.GEZU01044467.1~~GEZU01044467.1.p1  ORF type:complete len:156 (+),score=36.73 GEZU01044467.1:27-470(+)
MTLQQEQDTSASTTSATDISNKINNDTNTNNTASSSPSLSIPPLPLSPSSTHDDDNDAAVATKSTSAAGLLPGFVGGFLQRQQRLLAKQLRRCIITMMQIHVAGGTSWFSSHLFGSRTSRSRSRSSGKRRGASYCSTIQSGVTALNK